MKCSFGIPRVDARSPQTDYAAVLLLYDAPRFGDELDVLLLALPRECGAVETVVLFEDPFVVGLPHGHPLAKEGGIKPQHLLGEDLLLLKDGHCLRDHALAALRRLAEQRVAEFEATSLPTLVQMVDNGLGATLLPTMAVEAGLLEGTSLVTRPLVNYQLARKISLVWRRGTGRREVFELLAKETHTTRHPGSRGLRRGRRAPPRKRWLLVPRSLALMCTDVHHQFTEA